jgi:ketosteroid isomerase-like protein
MSKPPLRSPQNLNILLICLKIGNFVDMQNYGHKFFSPAMRIFALAMLCFIICAFNSRGADTTALRDAIIAKEREELDTLKSGDLKTFASLLADDAVFVDAHGAARKDEVVKNTKEFKLKEYSMEDVRFVPLSAESGLIIYNVTENGTSHGREFAAKVYVTALWAKRQGSWVCLFSQETQTK